MSEKCRLYAIKKNLSVNLPCLRLCYAIVAVIGTCASISACGSSPSTFEAVCPATLPRLSGQMAGLPAGWTVVTGRFPNSLQMLAVGEKTEGSARADREDPLPNGDVLMTWSIGHDYSPYAICSYFFTPVWLALKIPDNMASCQYISRHDAKARQVEPLKCSTSPQVFQSRSD